MIKVLKANEKFLDKTYGEWGAEWWNWLCSEDPDNISKSSPIVFLRANIDYEGERENRHQTGKHFEHQLTISKRLCECIFPCTLKHNFTLDIHITMKPRFLSIKKRCTE